MARAVTQVPSLGQPGTLDTLVHGAGWGAELLDIIQIPVSVFGFCPFLCGHSLDFACDFIQNFVDLFHPQ